jgi:hypothetical protein|tara:strand:- start:4009 stop:5991 length:1983 start_codon:yes stop_codon:yes gene_type:complete
MSGNKKEKWQEIANRGLQDRFDPETRIKFDEAVNRGLITLPSGAPQEEPNFLQQMPIFKPDMRPLPKDAPPWAHNNPELWNIANNVKSNVEPWLSTGATVAGSVIGAPTGPPGAVAGAALGYGSVKALGDQMDVWLGNRPDPGMVEAAKESVKNVGEGAMFEMGGQAIGPGIKTVWDRGVKPIWDLTGGAVVRGLKRVWEPWGKEGYDPIVGRMAVEAAGDRTRAVMNALREAARKAREGKDYVKGSKPTAGQAASPAGSTEFSALAEQGKAYTPTIYTDLAKANARARTKALQKIGGTADDLAAAIRHRDKVTDPMRKAAIDAANRTGVSNKPLLDNINKIRNEPGLRTIDAVTKTMDDLVRKIKDATKRQLDDDLGKKITGLSKNKNISAAEYKKLSKNNTINAKDLYSIRKGIGKDIKNNMKIKGDFDTDLAISLERKLQIVIDDLMEPASGGIWKKYLVKYKKLSDRADRMKLGQHFGKKLNKPTKAVGASEAAAPQKAAPIANALRNPKTVPKVTGFNRSGQSLSEVLTPKQMKAISGVAKDLTRKENYEALAKAGLKKAGIILEEIEPPQLINALWRPVMVVNGLLRRLFGKTETATLVRIGELMKDPNFMLDVMKRAKAKEIEAMIEIVTAVNAGRATTAVVSMAEQSTHAEQ